MTIRGKHHFCFHSVAVFAVLAVIFTTALTAIGLSADQTVKHTFEVRLASHEKVEGWERVPGPGLEKAFVWISPEVALTNSDVARAYLEPDRTDQSKLGVGILLTEEGALKMARLTKSHIGKNLAVILDGRAASVFPIEKENTSGRALISGNFTEEEARSIAKGIMMK
jgi:preprotein translocase subunit SecD